MAKGFRDLGLTVSDAEYFFNRFDKYRTGEFMYKDFIAELQPTVV